VVSVNLMKRKENHMSETESEKKLSVNNPLPGVEEVKETEMVDIAEEVAATAECVHTEN